MGTRLQQPLLIVLAALLASAPVYAQDAVRVSTPAASPVETPEPADKPERPEPPAERNAVELSQARAAAVAALRGLAAAYSGKRRSQFMKLVSDDYAGELGTLEDALSSDFRAYRSIVLEVIPGNVQVREDRALVQFRYDMTTTDDQGHTAKFGGQALYTFVAERGGAKLYRMDRTPIFGTSLSSIENPAPVAQGAAPAAGQTTAPGCNSTTQSGGMTLDQDTSQGFRFETLSVVSPASASADVYPFFGSTLAAHASGGIVDVGPCAIATFTTPPAAINNSTEPQTIGNCYAIRTQNQKFAVVRLVSQAGSIFTFQYKYQPSGARCF